MRGAGKRSGASPAASGGGAKPIAIAGTVQFAPAVAAASAAFAANALPPEAGRAAVEAPVPGRGARVHGPEAGSGGGRGRRRGREEEEEVEEEEQEQGGRNGGDLDLEEKTRNTGKKKKRRLLRLLLTYLLRRGPRLRRRRPLPHGGPDDRKPERSGFPLRPLLSRILTREHYDHGGMRRARKAAIATASMEELGHRPGNAGAPGLARGLNKTGGGGEDAGEEVSVVLVSELSPAKLAALTREEGRRRADRERHPRKKPESGGAEEADFPFSPPPGPGRKSRARASRSTGAKGSEASPCSRPTRRWWPGRREGVVGGEGGGRERERVLLLASPSAAPGGSGGGRRGRRQRTRDRGRKRHRPRRGPRLGPLPDGLLFSARRELGRDLPPGGAAAAGGRRPRRRRGGGGRRRAETEEARRWPRRHRRRRRRRRFS